MLKPFLWALAAGLAIVYIAREYRKRQAINSVTYHNAAGAEVFAGPDVDPITGTYTPPDAEPGTVGATFPQ